MLSSLIVKAQYSHTSIEVKDKDERSSYEKANRDPNSTESHEPHAVVLAGLYFRSYIYYEQERRSWTDNKQIAEGGCEGLPSRVPHPETQLRKHLPRGAKSNSCKFLAGLASRTGVEPVSPP
jgi:hypothetical protein